MIKVRGAETATDVDGEKQNSYFGVEIRSSGLL